MDIVLLSEVIKPHDSWSYPYNALRNHALVRSETEVREPIQLARNISASVLFMSSSLICKRQGRPLDECTLHV